MSTIKSIPPLREFVISRVFSATRERVWRAWTEPEQIDQWFGPKGVTTVASKNDLRVGGGRHFGMKNPDGSIVWGRATYLEITPPSKLMFINAFSDEKGGLGRHPMSPTWPAEMLTTVELEEVGTGKTKLTIHWIPINSTEEENKAFMAGFDSMTGGWSGTFERLENFLAKA